MIGKKLVEDNQASGRFRVEQPGSDSRGFFLCFSGSAFCDSESVCRQKRRRQDSSESNVNDGDDDASERLNKKWTILIKSSPKNIKILKNELVRLSRGSAFRRLRLSGN